MKILRCQKRHRIIQLCTVATLHRLFHRAHLALCGQMILKIGTSGFRVLTIKGSRLFAHVVVKTSNLVN